MDRQSPAERLYAEYLRAGDEDDPVAFDAFVDAHGEHRAALQRIWNVDRVLRPDSSSFFYRPEYAARLGREEGVEIAELGPGATLGPYELLRKIGQGGMGQVWEAREHGLERSVALKLINPGRVSQRTLEYFHREARAGARVRHPGVVTLYAAGEIDGVPYIAQELIEDAGTLADSFEAFRRMPDLPGDYYRLVAGLFLQISEALAAAHEVDVVHRDVKPRNILIAPGDRPLVSDFGLARILSEESLSASGEGAGTYAYMSPEQVGLRHDVDPRTDVFSLGVVLYEALTLTRPFDGDTPQQVTHKIVSEDPPDPRRVRSRVPADLALICGKALDKDRERRFPTMAAFADELRRHIANEPILVRPPSLIDRGRKWVLRNPARAGIVAVATVAIVVISALLAFALDAKRDLGAEIASVTRLSAVQDLEDLVAAADALWPVAPERIEPYRAWIDDAGALVAELPVHRARLAELRALALPRTDAERREQRASHPDHARLLAIEGELAARRRALAQRRDGIAAELPDVSGPAYPPAPNVLHALAVQYAGRERTEHGRERLGTALALRALELVGEGDVRWPAIASAAAWGYLALGRDEDALEWGFAAFEAAPGEAKEQFGAELGEIEKAVAEAASAEGRLAAEEAIRRLDESRVELDAGVDVRTDWTFPEGRGEARWWSNQLAKLVLALEALLDEETGLLSEAPDGASAEHGWSVPRRLSFAGEMQDEFGPGGRLRARWEAALPGIRDDYAGLALTMQAGLVPIGADPRSGLWEFWHVASGTEPAREDGTGELEITEASGLVLVLLRGGTYRMGAQATDPSAPNYDPEAQDVEGPVHEVTLSPFFLSKFEMTQGQWLRLAGENPSFYQFGAMSKSVDLTHPVDEVSWRDCVRVLPRFGLILPSEAQWEYGARGGTGTPWWTGRDRESLRELHAINLADQAAARTGAKWTAIADWPEMDDGYAIHAPVGTFAPNAFGLHEVLGNIAEVCLDQFEADVYEPWPQLDPVGRDPGAPHRPCRGGGYSFDSSSCRSSTRVLLSPTMHPNVGVRPACALRP